MKLNGVTANTKPSSGRYSIRFETPGGEKGCIGVDLVEELDVEAEEVDQLARGVDLGLVRVLALAEHRRGVQRRAPGARQQVRRAEEHRRAVLPRRRRPGARRCRGGGDRLLDFLLAAVVELREHVAPVVRLAPASPSARAHGLSADLERDLDLAARQLGDLRRELSRSAIPARSRGQARSEPEARRSRAPG